MNLGLPLSAGIRLRPFAGVAAAWTVSLICLGSCGCASVFSKPVMTASTQALPWLTNYAAPPVEASPPFDLGQIQPPPKTGISREDMLEVTIWDLYEPGKPHTFPTRVDAQGEIVVPYLDPVAVGGSTTAQVETLLIGAYRGQDLLKQPRILVRALSSTPLHIYVTGAVLRPGLIDLPAHDPSVFAALVAAGGLSRGAGLHVFVSDRQPAKPVDQIQASIPDQTTTAPLVAGNSPLSLPDPKPDSLDAPHTPLTNEAFTPEMGIEEIEQLINHSGKLAVPADGTPQVATGPDAAANAAKPGVVESVVTRPDVPSGAAPQNKSGRWFDLSVERDRESLKELVLRDGDMVTVRPAALPVRITGAVTQPGSYRAPATNALSLTDAVQLAGGFQATDMPLIVTLTRPATPEHGLQRWSFRFRRGESPPPNLPYVQPGDLVHVEPSARARVQSLMDAIVPGHRS